MHADGFTSGILTSPDCSTNLPSFLSTPTRVFRRWWRGTRRILRGSARRLSAVSSCERP